MKKIKEMLLGKSELMPDLMLNSNNSNFTQQDKKIIKNLSKIKKSLKSVEVPNLLKPKIYETTSNLILKKDSNNFENVKQEKNKIIFNKNSTPLILENKKKLIKNESNINETNVDSCSITNNDLSSSKSSWKFDKHLLDDSAFRKTNIKKEKMEIDCNRENKFYPKILSKKIKNEGSDIINDYIHDEMIDNKKFIYYSSAFDNPKNPVIKKETSLNLTQNDSKINRTQDKRQNNGFVKDNNNINNNYPNISMISENNISDKNFEIKTKSDILEINNKELNLKGDLDNKNNYENLKYNLSNVSNIEINMKKNKLLNINNNIAKNQVGKKNNINKDIINNCKNLSKNSGNKLSKSLSSFKFEFDEDELNQSSNTN